MRTIESISPREAWKAICEVKNLREGYLKHPLRKREYTVARTMYAIIRRSQRITVINIGREINRDHSTVVHALDNHEAWFMGSDDVYTRELTKVCSKLEVPVTQLKRRNAYTNQKERVNGNLEMIELLVQDTRKLLNLEDKI